MKIKELFEGPPPVFDPKEMPTFTSPSLGKFYSEGTIDRDFNKLGDFEIDSTIYTIIISKEDDFACIVKAGVRQPDNTPGGFIIAQADFKNPPNISYDRDIPLAPHVVQIDGVEIYDKKLKTKGLGFYFYFGMLYNGYVVISDNYQYLGGKELWKKIIRMSEFDFNYSVYVIDNGHVRMNGDEPVRLTSKDIENEEEFWSTKPNQDRFHTLFLAKKN